MWPVCNQATYKCTYINNEEVQPAPGICKVLDKAISHPFQQHLQDEDVGENTISILQDDTDCLPLFYVHVLKGLKSRRETSHRQYAWHETTSVIICTKVFSFF